MNAELFNQMLAALEATLTSDGCFQGCGRKQNSDVAHSFRCTRVAAAIGAAKAERACTLCNELLYNGTDRLVYGDRHERCEVLQREVRR